jgi:hypothetical protein
MRAPQIVRRAGGYAGSVVALVRRRREDKRPRVRVRIAHGETTVLAEDAPARERLLSLAEELAAEYAGYARRGRGGR